SCMLLIRHPRISNGAEQNRIKVLAEHVKRAGRQTDAFAEEFLGAPIELHEFQSGAEYFVYARQNPHRFAGDIDSDSVAWYDSDSFHDYYPRSLPSSGRVSKLYSVNNSCKCDSSSLAKFMKILRPLSWEICFAKSVKI